MATKIGESLRILQHVAAQADGVAEDAVIDALGLTPRVAHKMVSELVDLAYLHFSDGLCPTAEGAAEGRARRLMLGPSSVAFAGRVERHFPFSSIARRMMLELVQATRETVAINMYSRALMAGVCVSVEDGPHSLGYVIEVGEVKPLHAGASGKTLLACLAEQELDTVLARMPLLQVTPNTVTNTARLKEELAVVRNQGFCMTHGERVTGAVGIGVPLRLGVAQTAALVITIPEFRFQPETAHDLVALVQDKARAIEASVAGLP